MSTGLRRARPGGLQYVAEHVARQMGQVAAGLEHGHVTPQEAASQLRELESLIWQRIEAIESSL